MPYLIETFDKADHQHVRKANRPAHLDFLEANKSLLLACGAKLPDDGPGAVGGLYILDTDSRAEAERFIADDPLTAAGLFETVAVTQWRKAYFDGESCL